jgi:hypothetical protein
VRFTAAHDGRAVAPAAAFGMGRCIAPASHRSDKQGGIQWSDYWHLRDD